MRIPVPLASAYHLINHGACPLITTGDGTRVNAAPINWTMPACDDPFLIAIAVEKGIYTDQLIRETGQFIVNVVGEAMASEMLALGKSSGRNQNKLAALKIETLPGHAVNVVRIATSAAHVECQVQETHPLPGVNLYIGKALHAEVEQECWDGRHLLLEKIRTLHHIGGGLFAVTDHANRYESK